MECCDPKEHSGGSHIRPHIASVGEKREIADSGSYDMSRSSPFIKPFGLETVKSNIFLHEGFSYS